MIQVNKKNIPNKYIGSKSNCDVIDGKIISCRKTIYTGSSKNKLFKKDLEKYGYVVYVLGQFEQPLEALKYERETHLLYDVVLNSEFYNLSIATENNFTNPEYAIFKNIETGKIARIKRNHDMVLSGVWVGVTKGRILSEEEKRKKSRPGKLNPFYGKTHTFETKKLLKELCKKTFKDVAKTEEHKKKISMANKGKPKTPEHIAKLKLVWKIKKDKNL